MRKLGVAVACGVLLGCPRAALAEDADAGATPTTATMTCAKVDGPGRVRCEVEAHVASGESITWGDVILTATPAFATALRGRIGPHDATTREATTWRWALALAARERGTGTLEGLVRLVVCKGGTCESRRVAVTAQVVAGG